MQISGLVLDVYDDVTGDTLRRLFSAPSEIPDFVKRAEALTPTSRERLPDNVYALVLQDGDRQYRKYACTDPGNTALSVLYFHANADKLPTEAQKVAAANLAVACDWYGLDELAKEAGLLGAAAAGLAQRAVSNPVGAISTAVTAPALVQGTHHEIKGRLGAIRQFERGGGGVATPEQLDHLRKSAEVSGTALMPLGGPESKSPQPTLATVKKTGAAAVRVMRPHVDVTSKEASRPVTEKVATHTACPGSHPGRYPLDTFEQVKRAAAYFEEYGNHFPPAERREFCQYLVPRADALTIEVSKTARKYASTTYAPADEIKVAFDGRRRRGEGQVVLRVLDALEEKVASLPPDLFCAVLSEFDRATGLDRHYNDDVYDPYFSTYGVAHKVASGEDWSWIDGNTYLTHKDLSSAVKVRSEAITRMFGSEFLKKMRANAVETFEGLPRDQKHLVAKLLTDSFSNSDFGS